jgi:hypothetical protein
MLHGITEGFLTTIRTVTGCQANQMQLHLHCESSLKIGQAVYFYNDDLMFIH